MPDITIGQNDTGPPAVGAFSAASGSVTLTSAVFSMESAAGVLVITDAVCTLGPGTGEATYVWKAVDTAIPGMFLAQFKAVLSDGSIVHFPNGRRMVVEITQTIG